jgi:hypothetical protein
MSNQNEITELPDRFVVQLTDPKANKVGYMGFKRIHKRVFQKHWIPTNWTSNSNKFVRFIQDTILSLAISCGGALTTEQIINMINKPYNGVVPEDQVSLLEDSLGIKFFD